MSTKSLWDYYDGEPFMENPNLGILAMNPKRYMRRIATGRYEYDYVPSGETKRKRGKKMAGKRRQPAALRKYWATHRKGRKRAAPRVNRKRRVTRRRSRRNWPVAGIVSGIANPRRKRRYHARSAGSYNPRRRRRHARRNPSLMGFRLPPIKSVVFAGVGFAGPGVLTGFLNQMVPSVVTQIQSMGIAGKYIMKIGTIAMLYFGTKRFVGSNEANMVLIGGGLNVGLSAVGDFAPGLLPAGSLMSYTIPNRGMQAYTLPRKGLNAVPVAQPRLGVTARNPWGTAAAFPDMQSYGIAARFKRF